MDPFMNPSKERGPLHESDRRPIRSGWEAAASRYRDGLGRHLIEISHRLSRFLPAPLTGPVLDLACGPGTAMSQTKEAHGELLFVGCDFSRRMTEFATRAVSGSLGVVADQDHLPFAPESFGTILSSMGTIFSRDPDRQLRLIAALLKPGGLYAFSAWGPPEETSLGAVSRTVVESWPYPYEGVLPSLATPYSGGQSPWLEQAASEAGLSVRAVSSHWLRFRFPDVMTAANALVGTGRFALLLSGAEHRERELLERTAEAFRPHKMPGSEQIELSNRYHLFLLERTL